jgi:pimeloyl-ACP methyl ester carboxylesterase
MLVRRMTSSDSLQRGDCTIAWEVRERPAPASTPVLLLHGFGTGRAAMVPLADSLLERGATPRTLLADARGHGETRAPARDDAYGYPSMRDDCIALLERVAPDGAHLVGHSMGGQVALLAALQAPALVHSLSLIAAGPCRSVSSERERASWERAATRFERGNADEVAAALSAAAPTRDPRLTPGALYGAARGEDLARVVRGGFLRVESNTAACARLATPTLLLVGDQDAGWLDATRKLASLVPGAELEILADAGHMVHLEQPEPCAATIAAFLARLG